MSKRNKAKKTVSQPYLVCIAAVILVLIVVGLVLSHYLEPNDPTIPTGTKPAYSIQIEEAEDVSINLGYGMYLEDVAKYTGVYMEDGTDEVVSGILMVMVKNTGPQDIQYAEIELPVGDERAMFTLTNLPVGESVVLLEKNRMAYNSEEKYQTAIVKNVIVFQEPMSLHTDKLKIQEMNGVLNVTNISGEDITADVVIYYKNSSADMLYGGITYRVVISGGIPKGVTQQILAGHFRASGSRIVQVTCGEAA